VISFECRSSSSSLLGALPRVAAEHRRSRHSHGPGDGGVMVPAGPTSPGVRSTHQPSLDLSRQRGPAPRVQAGPAT
jgi:hypothetical protein